jgi:hypothetical protein
MDSLDFQQSAAIPWQLERSLMSFCSPLLPLFPPVPAEGFRALDGLDNGLEKNILLRPAMEDFDELQTALLRSGFPLSGPW